MGMGSAILTPRVCLVMSGYSLGCRNLLLALGGGAFGKYLGHEGRALTKERGGNRSLQTCKGLKIRMSEEEACAQTYGSGETPCRSLPHIHAHKRASLAEETLTTPRNKLTYPVEVHQLLSLATPVLAQWLRKQSGSGAQDRGNTWIQNLGTTFSSRDSGLFH